MSVLIAEAGRPLAGPLSHLPGIAGCNRVILAVQDELTGQTQWHAAAAMATRIIGCTTARKTEADDSALVLSEIAKSLSRYPPAIASHVTEHVLETMRFRPTPAEIHEAAKARITDLRIAAAMAEKVIKAHQHMSALRRETMAEREEEARAIAEGRETPSQRRARAAAAAREVIEKIRAAPEVQKRSN